MRRIRGAIGMGLTWGFAWFLAGMVLLLIVGPDAADVPFPLGFGALGFLAGATFSVVVSIVGRRRRFDELSLPRFAGWGAAGGLVFSGIFAGVAALFGSPEPLQTLPLLAPLFSAAGAGCAAGALALARRAEAGGRLEGGADVDQVGLTEEERRKLLGLLLAIALMPGTLAAQVDGNARLQRVDSTDHIGAAAREPMVVRHPGGTLFVSGYGGALRGYRGADTLAPRLWSSVDGGSTWARVDVGGPEDGAVGNSDVDLAVAPDGTLYFVTLRFDRERGEGVHVAMGVSRDGGGSWAWTLLDRARFDDRPWVEVAPDGTAHALWSSGAGIFHSTSTDRGVTWDEPARVHPGGGSSHLAVGPGGELAVRIAPRSAAGRKMEEGVDFVAVSTDGGRTWQKHPPPASVPWPAQPSDSAPPRWVEPLAWDAEGALYALWSEADAMRLGRSTDRGGTWTIWTVARSDVPVFYPYLVSRNDGELAATWMSWLGDAEIRGHVAHITLTDEGPRVATADFPLRSWVVAADGSRWADAGGEYMGVTFLPDGSVGVVAPIQDPAADAFGFTWRRFVRR